MHENNYDNVVIPALHSVTPARHFRRYPVSLLSFPLVIFVIPARYFRHSREGGNPASLNWV